MHGLRERSEVARCLWKPWKWTQGSETLTTLLGGNIASPQTYQSSNVFCVPKRQNSGALLVLRGILCKFRPLRIFFSPLYNYLYSFGVCKEKRNHFNSSLGLHANFSFKLWIYVFQFQGGAIQWCLNTLIIISYQYNYWER